MIIMTHSGDIDCLTYHSINNMIKLGLEYRIYTYDLETYNTLKGLKFKSNLITYEDMKNVFPNFIDGYLRLDEVQSYLPTMYSDLLPLFVLSHINKEVMYIDTDIIVLDKSIFNKPFMCHKTSIDIENSKTSRFINPSIFYLNRCSVEYIRDTINFIDTAWTKPEYKRYVGRYDYTGPVAYNLSKGKSTPSDLELNKNELFLYKVLNTLYSECATNTVTSSFRNTPNLKNYTTGNEDVTVTYVNGDLTIIVQECEDNLRILEFSRLYLKQFINNLIIETPKLNLEINPCDKF